MANNSKVKNYNAFKDTELTDALRNIKRIVPLSEDGHVIRTEAIRMLKEYDSSIHDYNRKARVIFHNSSSPSAGPYVFASVNERNFQAPYEKEVLIPAYFLKECIDRARTKIYEYGPDGITPVIKYIPTYPYTLLGYVEPTEDDTATIITEA